MHWHVNLLWCCLMLRRFLVLGSQVAFWTEHDLVRLMPCCYAWHCNGCASNVQWKSIILLFVWKTWNVCFYYKIVVRQWNLLILWVQESWKKWGIPFWVVLGWAWTTLKPWRIQILDHILSHFKTRLCFPTFILNACGYGVTVVE